MEDFELIALKKLKEELIVKAYNLIEKLKQQEEDQQIVIIKLYYFFYIIFQYFFIINIYYYILIYIIYINMYFFISVCQILQKLLIIQKRNYKNPMNIDCVKFRNKSLV